MIQPGQVACADCGMVYGSAGWIDALIPNAAWKLISPDDAILCITCIARRSDELGLNDVPVMLASGPLRAEECKGYDQGGREFLQRDYTQP